MSATLDNLILAFEIAFLPIIQAKLLLLPVLGGHLGFHQDAACIRCRSTITRVDDPWIHGISLWDRTSIKYTTVVITTSGLSAAMLELMVVGNPSSFALHVPASAVPDGTIIAFEIYILSQMQPEIRELPFYWRHLGFPVQRYVRQCRQCHRWKVWPQKHGVAAGILFLSALELEIHLGGNSTLPLHNQRKYFILDIRSVKYR
jgi:hypothetical protein